MTKYRLLYLVLLLIVWLNNSTPVITKPILQNTEDCAALLREARDFYIQGRYTEELEQYQRALFCYREIDSQQGEWTTLNRIGLFYYDMGKYELSLIYYKQALSNSRR